MNAITKALQEVRFRINPEILNLAFTGNSRTSLDERILSSIVRPRVLVDCDIVGGTQLIIPLSRAELQYVGPDGYAVYIPKNLTNNRTIVSAMSIVSNGDVYMGVTDALMENPYANDLLNEANTLGNNLSNHSYYTSSALEIVNENTVFVHDYLYDINALSMRVMVSNDSMMRNINPRSYLAFSELVVLAVQAYIFNTATVMLDKGYIQNGHEIGRIKDLIDQYENKDEEYREYLRTKWAKVAFMNDTPNFDRFIHSMFNNNI